MEEFAQSLLHLVDHLGYLGIFLATLVESTFVPVPAEFTMIPAGILAAKGEMNYWAVLGSSALGVLVGSLINYWVGLYFGRALLLRFGKYIFIKPTYLEKTEKFFAKFGTLAAFSGRLLPGVRHYIGFVAGIARMKLRPFVVATALGGLIWMWILLQISFMAQLRAERNGGTTDIESIEAIILIITLVTLAAYFVKQRLMRHHH
jgi:membrane protein DedA with SNARE-associated domain